MRYNRCGRSGLLLPAFSLGMWYNFGERHEAHTKRAICRRAFDLGITHFDLANNYGPPSGSAEEAFGVILKQDFAGHRDELLASTKAGYPMWSGPYGSGGGRKHLVASLDQSLKRLGLDYVDIFYHHCPDPETPLEESMGALDYIVRSGRALYAGISSYPAELTEKAAAIGKSLGTPLIIHQPRFNMLQRDPLSQGVFAAAAKSGMGVIVFSPLAQGMLTGRYLDGIPNDSRYIHGKRFNRDALTPEFIDKIKALNAIAANRGQSLAQMALAWVLTHGEIASCLIGASKPEQVEDSVKAADNTSFSTDELAEIDRLTA